MAVVEARKQPAHALLRVVLHVAHVGAHDVEAEVLDHAVELGFALGVGCNLRLEVGDVLVRLACRVLRAREQRARLGFEEAASLHQFDVVDIDAFLGDGGGARRHRAGREPADVLVVAAARDVEQHLSAGGVEHRRHHGDVGQMRAAVVRRVQHVGIARAHLGSAQADDGLDRAVHGTEVDGQMRRVGDERALGIEHRAREVEPLLDVDRLRRVAQRFPHLLGDRHEQVVEHLEQDGIGLGAELFARARLGAREDEVVLRRDLEAPAGLDDDGLVRLDDERGTGEREARAHVLALHDGRLVPCAARIKARLASPRSSGERVRVRGSRWRFLWPLTPTLSP